MGCRLALCLRTELDGSSLASNALVRKRIVALLVGVVSADGPVLPGGLTVLVARRSGAFDGFGLAPTIVGTHDATELTVHRCHLKEVPLHCTRVVVKLKIKHNLIQAAPTEQENNEVAAD